MTENSKRTSSGLLSLKKSEKLKNYATAISIAVPAITGLILGILANVRGEPKAEIAYKQISKQTAKMVDNMDSLQLQISKLDCYREDTKSAKLEADLKALQVKYDTLLAKTMPAEVLKQQELVVAVTEPDCPAARLPDAAGKCRPVPHSVAKRVNQDQAKIEQSLVRERKRRAELERKKQELQAIVQRGKSYKRIEKLPPTLDALGK